MITGKIKTAARGFLLSLVFILGMSSVSWAAEFWLRAEAFDKTMPDGASIRMWGFAQCIATYATCSAPTVPGPALTVPVGDTSLTIHLRNNITGPYTEAISLIIPGQAAALSPAMFTDASGRQRVRSFTTETPADNSTTVDYIWNNIKPGTFLYQSGSHPAVQVQMGLYGALKKDAAAGQAYDATTAYDAEAVLLFSEIDPILHIAVQMGSYGPGGTLTSTMNYEPKYFLINGASFPATAPIPAGSAGGRTLLRFLNAGLKERVPTLNGLNLSLIAEDGNKYLYPKERYSMLLSAGKTMDAIITPAAAETFAVFDRRLGLTNGAVSGGGMLAYLNVASGVTPTTATAIGVYDPPTAQWYLDFNRNGAWDGTPTDSSYNFGFAGVVPVTGDWNGSGTAKIGVYDPATSTWYLDMNGNGAWDGATTDSSYYFGFAGVVPVTGNWTGTGGTKIGVYDPATSTWYLDMNGNGIWEGATTDASYYFGFAGVTPVTGNWTGTGGTKIGVYDPAASTWYLDMNGNGIWEGATTDASYNFGFSGVIPVTGNW